MKRFLNLFVLAAFCLSNIPAYALTPVASAAGLTNISAAYQAPVLKGLRVDPKDPLKMSFIIDTADKGSVAKDEAARLVRYFLAALAVPQKDLWVNLSPYEQNRIIPQALGDTDLGQEMLSLDYLLKQLSASLTHPDTDSGKAYWNSSTKASLSTNALVQPSLTKVWIVPNEALVYEHADTAVIAKSSMKAQTETDYLANSINPKNSSDSSTQSFKANILPLINTEINSGKNFSELRQIYSALVLASWFKQKFYQSFYKNYINQNKIGGIDTNDKNFKDKVYAQYVEAFKKGAYNMTASERVGQKIIKRSYFSGGIRGDVNTTAQPATGKQVDGVAHLGPLVEVKTETVSTPVVSDDDESGLPVVSSPTTGKVKIVFGTSGFRGQIGKTFTPDEARQVSQGVADYYNSDIRKGYFLVIYDPRKDNAQNARDTAAILAANKIPVKVIIDEPTPTPVGAELAQIDEDCIGVINYTASHNLFEDDGFKLSPYHGGAAPKEVTDRVEQLANAAKTYKMVDYNAAVKSGAIVEIDSGYAVQKYVHEYLIPTAKKIGAWDDIVAYLKAHPQMTIVGDPMQGTAVKYIKALIEELSKDVGRTVGVMIHDDNRDPRFSQVGGAPNPTLEKSVKELKEELAKHTEAFAFAVDGDADRFGPEPANDIIALMTYFLGKEIGMPGKVCKTVATTNFVNAVAKHIGRAVDETPVGYKHAVKLINEGNEYLVAGEESAHVGVLPFMQSWDDGIAINLVKLWMQARTGKTLPEYKKHVEKAIGKAFFSKTITVRGKDDSIKADVAQIVARTKAELAAKKSFSETTAGQQAERLFGEKIENIITVDGVKIVFESGAWILLRPSGTEPAVKLYVEVTDEARMNALEAVGRMVLKNKQVISFEDERIECLLTQEAQLSEQMAKAENDVAREALEKQIVVVRASMAWGSDVGRNIRVTDLMFARIWAGHKYDSIDNGPKLTIDFSMRRADGTLPKEARLLGGRRYAGLSPAEKKMTDAIVKNKISIALTGSAHMYDELDLALREAGRKLALYGALGPQDNGNGEGDGTDVGGLAMQNLDKVLAVRSDLLPQELPAQASADIFNNFSMKITAMHPVKSYLSAR